MIRDWVSSNATQEGLQQFMSQTAEPGEEKEKEKPKTKGPSKKEIMGLMGTLRGGRVQKGNRSRGRRR